MASTPPPQNRGRPRDPATDEAVLAATRELLASGGPDAVTYEAVARHAGVSRPTVYLRFPRKADLIFEAGLALATPPPEFLGPGSPIVPDTGSLEGDLAVVADVAAASFAGLDGAGILRPFFSALAGDAVLAARLWHEAVGPAQGLLLGVLARWAERGEIAEDLATDEVLEVFPAIEIYRRVVLDRPLTGDERARLVRVVADGLRR